MNTPRRPGYNQIDQSDESLNAELMTRRGGGEQGPGEGAAQLEKVDGVPINPLTAPGGFASGDRIGKPE